MTCSRCCSALALKFLSPARAGLSHMTKIPSSRPEPSVARRSGGTCFIAASTKQVPRLRRPSGGFARDDGGGSILWPFGLQLQRLVGLDAAHQRPQPGIVDDRRVERHELVGERLAIDIAHD